MKTLLATLATGLALFASPARAADYVFQPAPVPGADDLVERDADPAIWVVRDPDTTVYLFGTIHILKPGLRWFADAVKRAYDSADELVIEMVEPPADEAQRRMLAVAVNPSGTPLRDELSPEHRARYEAALTTLGRAPDAFDHFKPWFAGMMLGVLPLDRSGYDRSAGVERSLLADTTKPVEGLETFEGQLGFFDGLSQADQLAFLNATVDGMDEYLGDTDELVDAWAAGDVDTVAALMNEGLEDSPPAVAKVLLADRNARWAKWIEERLEQPGTVFLAVGAGHLAGPDSVQEKLASAKLVALRIQ